MRLLGPVERLREAWLIRQADDGADLPADGLPLPPARLRLLVDGRSGDAGRFLVLGKPMFESIRDAVIESGRRPDRTGRGARLRLRLRPRPSPLARRRGPRDPRLRLQPGPHRLGPRRTSLRASQRQRIGPADRLRGRQVRPDLRPLGLHPPRPRAPGRLDRRVQAHPPSRRPAHRQRPRRVDGRPAQPARSANASNAASWSSNVRGCRAATSAAPTTRAPTSPGPCSPASRTSRPVSLGTPDMSILQTGYIARR